MKCTHKPLRTQIQYVGYIYLGMLSTDGASCKLRKGVIIFAAGSLILGGSRLSQGRIFFFPMARLNK